MSDSTKCLFVQPLVKKRGLLSVAVVNGNVGVTEVGAQVKEQEKGK